MNPKIYGVYRSPDYIPPKGKCVVNGLSYEDGVCIGHIDPEGHVGPRGTVGSMNGELVIYNKQEITCQY